MNASAWGRRIYRWELTHLRVSDTPYLGWERSIDELRAMTARIWRHEAPAATPMPAVVAGRGCIGSSSLLSFYEPNQHRIVLCRQQRNFGVLLHEIAHALGPRDRISHGPAFIDRVLGLYVQYGRVPMWRVWECPRI